MRRVDQDARERRTMLYPFWKLIFVQSTEVGVNAAKKGYLICIGIRSRLKIQLER